MTARNGKSGLDTSVIANVAAAERLAAAVVSAFDSCAEAGVPLAAIQRIAVIQALLLEFDGFEAQLSTLESVRRLLDDLGRT